MLKRAIKTLWIVLDEMDLMWVPVQHTLAPQRAPLRRAAGAQQGRDGREVRRRAGARSGAAATTSRRLRSTPDDERFPGRDPRYAGLRPSELPLTESLKDTIARFLPYWHDDDRARDPRRRARDHRRARQQPARAGQAPRRRLGGRILELNIPTGIPLVYELDEKTLAPLRHFYLGDPEAAKKAADAVAKQGKA